MLLGFWVPALESPCDGSEEFENPRRSRPEMFYVSRARWCANYSCYSFAVVWAVVVAVVSKGCGWACAEDSFFGRRRILRVSDEFSLLNWSEIVIPCEFAFTYYF